MASAAALGIGALAMSAAGTGMSVFGQLQQGKSDKRVAEFNARQQEAEAANVELESRESTRRGRRENERILGSQKAAAAKSGVVISTGSPLAAMAENAALLEMDVLDEKRAATMRANQLRTGAQLSIMKGKESKKASKIAAFSTLLSGAAGMGGKVSNYRRKGVL
jgi:hypothetical protein